MTNKEPESESDRLRREQRSQAGKLGALTTHSRHSGADITANARRAFLAKFELEVDPEGKLPIEERRRRAEYAKRLYFIRLAEVRNNKKEQSV